MQFSAMMEALRNSLGLRDWMDFTIVMGVILLPLNQYVLEFRPSPTCGVLVVPVDISILK